MTKKAMKEYKASQNLESNTQHKEVKVVESNVETPPEMQQTKIHDKWANMVYHLMEEEYEDKYREMKIQ